MGLIVVCLLLLASCTATNSTSDSSSASGGLEQLSNIAKVETMSATPLGWGGSLNVELKPINPQVNTPYTVDLYEKGNLMQSQNITWNEPEINTGEVLSLDFNLSEDEYNAYSAASENNGNWWKSIYSVEIYGQSATTPNQSQSALINPNGTVTLKLLSPNGGETYHVGETVKITWTSTNIEKNGLINISLIGYYSYSTYPISSVPNTGSYKFTIPKGLITSSAKIELMANAGTYEITAISTNNFTITN